MKKSLFSVLCDVMITSPIKVIIFNRDLCFFVLFVCLFSGYKRRYFCLKSLINASIIKTNIDMIKLFFFFFYLKIWFWRNWELWMGITVQNHTSYKDLIWIQHDSSILGIIEACWWSTWNSRHQSSSIFSMLHMGEMGIDFLYKGIRCILGLPIRPFSLTIYKVILFIGSVKLVFSHFHPLSLLRSA